MIQKGLAKFAGSERASYTSAMLRRRSASILLLAPALLAAVALWAPPADGTLVPEGGAPDLVVLFTGDVLGYIEPCG
jgi:hypothetical protein